MERDKIISQLDEYRSAFHQLQTGHNEAVSIFLSSTIIFVHSLSSAERELIHTHPYFERRTYTPSKNKILFHFFLCIMNAECDAVYKQASSYARALIHLYERDHLDEETVQDELNQHGGVEDLRRHVNATEKNAKAGLGVLHIEGEEHLVESLLDIDKGRELSIKVKRVDDGVAGWKRFVLSSVEDDEDY